MMDSSAYAHHVGVAMVRLEDDSFYGNETWIETFSKRYLDKSAQPFWKRMGGEQRVRTSAWTSSKVA